jgi:hypothetical protein
MQYHKQRIKTIESYPIAYTYLAPKFTWGLFCLCAFILLSPAILLADQPSSISIKMLHIFISADVNKVRFENIWVFQRQIPERPWQVNINLPEAAAAVSFDEPNETEFIPDSGTIRKRMAADSLIDSVGFSFVLPNHKGTCQTQITPPYPVDSMAVCVSGRTVKLESPTLKFNQFKTLRSKFFGVYTASNLTPATNVNINLTGLPSEDSSSVKTICLLGLGLIILIALLTLFWKRKPIKDKSSTDEASLK